MSSEVEQRPLDRQVIRLPKFIGATNDWDFSQGGSIIEALYDSRVFTIEKTPDGRFDFADGCDGVFGAVLTKEQMLQLAAEIVAITEAV